MSGTGKFIVNRFLCRQGINLNVPNDKNFFGQHFAALISIQLKEILLKEHFYFHAPALSCYIHEDACYKTTRIPRPLKQSLASCKGLG